MQWKHTIYKQIYTIEICKKEPKPEANTIETNGGGVIGVCVWGGGGGSC